MGKDVFRTGDLVQYGTVYYINGNKIYYVCKIMEIQSDNKSWDRLEVVTGTEKSHDPVKLLQPVPIKNKKQWKILGVNPSPGPKELIYRFLGRTLVYVFQTSVLQHIGFQGVPTGE